MDNKKVFIAGGTGFVGSYIIKELINSGYEVKALVRDGIGTLPDKVISVPGDILSSEGWYCEAAECGTFINLVGIIREYPKRGVTFKRMHVDAAQSVTDFCKSAKVERLIHMSANGASFGGVSGYQTTKYQAEEIVKASGLNYTIMRPSLIFGPGDAFLNNIAKQMKDFRVFPIFGDGEYLLQPISAEDVAKVFTRSIEKPACFKRIFHLGGPAVYSYRELIHILADTLGGKIYMPHIPMKAIRLMASMLGRFSFFPITRDQLDMLSEGNVCLEGEIFDICEIHRRNLKEYIVNHFK